MRVLSTYIMGGFGHIKPAHAIAQQFQKLNIPAETYDIFSVDGRPNYESANIYHSISRSPILLPLWNLLTRHDLLPAWVFAPIHFFEVLQNKKTILKLQTYAHQYPDLIFTATHWTPALLAAKAFPDKTIFLYITDIHPHGLWYVSPPNIHYLVPMEETKIDLTRYGVDSSRISIASFPVNQAILNESSIRHQRRQNKFAAKNPNLIQVLIMSGGAGTGGAQMTRLVEMFSPHIKTDQVRLNFLVSTPALVKTVLAAAVEHQTHKHQINVQVYTPETFYTALINADILITKAGGDITFEALAEGLPIYTLQDVGDHERLNRQYLELIGASKPLFYHSHPWELIQSDLFTGEIALMAQASYQHGEFHRQASVPPTIFKVLENATRP